MADLHSQALNHLKQLYQLDDQTVSGLLDRAASTLKENILLLQDSISISDLEQVKKTGHSLKGALLNLGLDDLSSQANAIETVTILNEKTVGLVQQFVRNMTEGGLI